MIEVFNQSRINLNFAESSADDGSPGKAERFVRDCVRQPLLRVPGGWRAVAGAERAAQGFKHLLGQTPPRQIKGRVFEVPGPAGSC